MGTFDGKVVIVTGGAHGIGRDTAIEFAKEGASVVIADVNEEAGRAVETELNQLGTSGLLVVADVALLAECSRVVAETVKAFGGVDVLFNNVGIQSPDSYRNVEDTSEEMWDRILNVNLKSYYMMSKFAIPEMRKRGAGSDNQHCKRSGTSVTETGTCLCCQQGRCAVADTPNGS